MLLRTLLAFGFNAFLLAQTWPLASPGDWKVRPEWAGAPAVVLEDRTTFRRGNIDRYRKVLIFTEAGRLVAQPDIPARAVLAEQDVGIVSQGGDLAGQPRQAHGLGLLHQDMVQQQNDALLNLMH